MSRFVDLINKKFTGEQRKEDIPVLYYDNDDELDITEIKCKSYKNVEIKIYTNGVTVMLFLKFPMEIFVVSGKTGCRLNDRTGKRIMYNHSMEGDCTYFSHLYKRNRNNSHKYTFDEVNKDAHAAIDNIMKKEDAYMGR